MIQCVIIQKFDSIPEITDLISSFLIISTHQDKTLNRLNFDRSSYSHNAIKAELLDLLLHFRTKANMSSRNLHFYITGPGPKVQRIV